MVDKIIDRASGSELDVVETDGVVELTGSSDVHLGVSVDSVESLARSGNDLVVVSEGGGTTVIGDFFVGSGNGQGSRIFLNGTTEVSGTQRRGDDMIVRLENGDVLVIEGFYNKNTGVGEGNAVAGEGSVLELADESSLLSGGGAAVPPWALLAGGVTGTAAVAAAAGEFGGGSSDGDGSSDGSDTAASTPLVATLPPPVIDPTNGSVISGTAVPGSTIEVDVDGDEVADFTTTADPDTGAFRIDLDPALDDGQLTTATVRDADGNFSLAATVTVDATPPPIPVINPTNGSVISGTAEAGSTVEVDVSGDGSRILTTIADGDGAWSVDLRSAPLADGQAVSVTVTDAAGNTSLAATATVDATAPGSPVVNQANGTAIAGTAEAGSTITIDFEDAALADLTTTVDETGAWSIDVTSVDFLGIQLPRFGATATDAAGNTSQAVSGRLDPVSNATVFATDGTVIYGTAETFLAVIDVDVDADGTTDYTFTTTGDSSWAIDLDPDLLIGQDVRVTVTDAAGNIASTTVTVGAVTGISAFSFSTGSAGGTAKPGSTVELDVDGDGVTDFTPVVGTQGIWNVNFPIALAEGQVITAFSRDAAGNTSPTVTARAGEGTAGTSGEIRLTPIQGPGPSSSTESDISAANGTLNDASLSQLDTFADATVGDNTTEDVLDFSALVTPQIVNGGGAPNFTMGAEHNVDWSADPKPAVANGQFITTPLTDAAGNTSQAETVTVDTVAPSLRVGATDGTTLSGLTEAFARVDVDVDGTIFTKSAGDNGDWHIDLSSVPLSNGQEVSVTVTDAAGNTSQAETVTVDTVAPSLRVGATDGTTLSGLTEAFARVDVDVDGTIFTKSAGDNGDWHIDLSSVPLSNGQEVSVTVTDAAGNTSQAETVTVDTVAPSLRVGATDGTTLSGLTEAFARVDVDVDGTIFTKSAGDNGDWHIDLSSVPLSNGQEVSVTVTDAAGNTSQAETVTVDTVAPSLRVGATDGTTLSGLTEAFARVDVDVDGTIFTKSAGDNGDWHIDLSSVPLSNGQEVSVTVTDAAGNTSQAETVTVDTVAPSLRVGATDGTTLSGLTEAFARVDVDVDGTIFTKSAGDNGDWHIDLSSVPLSNGQEVSVTVTDAAGNTSQAETVTVDTVAPSLRVGATDGTTLSGLTEAFARVDVDVDGTIFTKSAGDNGDWHIDLSSVPLSNGQEVSVTVTDAAGNTSQAETVTVDTVAPSLRVGATDGTTLSGLTEAFARVDVDVDGTIFTKSAGDNGDWHIDLSSVPLSNGQEVSVTVTDAAGNTSQAETVTVDTVAPSLRVGATDGTTLSGLTEAFARVDVDVDGTIFTQLAGDSGDWSINFGSVPLSNGQEVSVTVTDAAGNTSQAETVTVDTVAPAMAATGYWGETGETTLTGGLGRDTFGYGSENAGDDTITDFTKGMGGDIIDISDLLIGFGNEPTDISNDISDFVTSSDDGSGNAVLTIDHDGGGPQSDGVTITPENIAQSNDLLDTLIPDFNHVVG